MRKIQKKNNKHDLREEEDGKVEKGNGKNVYEDIARGKWIENAREHGTG